MDPVLFFAFLTTTLVFLAVPGPSVAFATAQALRFGPGAACIAVAGDALGTVLHVAVAVAGLTALVALSQLVLAFLQILARLFIVWMAVNTLATIGRPVGQLAQRSGRATFWAGFFACVTNPKAIVFFVALFPAFISPHHNGFLQGAVYGAIFIILDAVSILAYALFARAALSRTTSRWVNAELLSALGLFGVGVAMLIKGYRSLPSN